MTREIKLYDADSLEYRGSIIAEGPAWHLQNCDNAELAALAGMPLKAVLVNLIIYNLVYDEIVTSHGTDEKN